MQAQERQGNPVAIDRRRSYPSVSRAIDRSNLMSSCRSRNGEEYVDVRWSHHHIHGRFGHPPLHPNWHLLAPWQFALPSIAQRHILAGLASAVGGLSAPYERASRIHERHVVNWLWAVGYHLFGPFSNSSQISQILQDVALRTTIYAQVDAALRKNKRHIRVCPIFCIRAS
uniref:Uncharacterized protein n=2 Tax=Zea mays TaxID=4577 RepID=A0A804NSK9_MAIZE